MAHCPAGTSIEAKITLKGVLQLHSASRHHIMYRFIPGRLSTKAELLSDTRAKEILDEIKMEEARSKGGGVLEDGPGPGNLRGSEKVA